MRGGGSAPHCPPSKVKLNTGMAQATVLYSSAIKLKTELSIQLDALMAGTSQYSTASASLHNGLDRLLALVTNLKDIARREPVQEKRDALLGRVDGLRIEYESLRATVSKHLLTYLHFVLLPS